MIVRIPANCLIARALMVFGIAAPAWSAVSGQFTKLIPDDSAVSDAFGKSVALSDNMALVGGPGGEWPRTSIGAVYLFDLPTGQQQMKLTASDGKAGNRFGVSVAVSNNIALVGAIHDDASGDGSGAAYVFDITTGQELMKLTPSDTSLGDYFGWSVAASGNIALIGANGNKYSRRQTGAAYLFAIAHDFRTVAGAPTHAARTGAYSASNS